MPENGKGPLSICAPRERALDPLRGFTVWSHRLKGLSRKRGANHMYEVLDDFIPESDGRKESGSRT